ncbi:SLC13 family permease [Psychroflexus aestuariivivens]|uniref:SLC13 family permease n=1 Tax=Psychroflexus aestuariivivens TaxID=1795040 RepID=UPI000FD71553|nr:SLC13 family permease [Psychroflexus aestuariivivens]
MTVDVIITLCVIAGAMVLFATEVIRVDLVALLIIVALVITGVITPQQGVEGFSNNATITVAFMFALSAAMLQTGALQFLAQKLSKVFENNFNQGMILMMILIAVISAFINNTPVVAVFIPVVIKIANSSGYPPNKLLIPLSFASIFGGTCTLVGTSTNILVSGIAEKENLEPISMFQLTPIGLIFLVVGILYMLFIGIRLIPKKKEEKNLSEKFGMKDYLTEIKLAELKDNEKEGKPEISELIKMNLDSLEVSRGDKNFSLPSKEMQLQEGDIIKVRCSGDKIKKLKKWAEKNDYFKIDITNVEEEMKNSSLMELIIVANSPLAGKKLGDTNFKGRFRAIPLAVRQRKGVTNENLSDIKLKAGDVILAEVRNSFKENIEEMAKEAEAPLAILSEDKIVSFNKRNFYIVLAVIIGVIGSASLGFLDIMTAAIAGVSMLVLLGILNMKKLYKAIDWKVIFLLAGALSLGTAMANSGLDQLIAESMFQRLDLWGPIAVLSGLYLLTSLLTELMTNNAAAALLAPIAIATANSLDLSPIPFLMAIAFAGSASFMTPVGYQTNTMVYSAGKYNFKDFLKVGTILNIIFWIIATFMIPVFYGF